MVHAETHRELWAHLSGCDDVLFLFNFHRRLFPLSKVRGLRRCSIHRNDLYSRIHFYDGSHVELVLLTGTGH